MNGETKVRLDFDAAKGGKSAKKQGSGASHML